MRLSTFNRLLFRTPVFLLLAIVIAAVLASCGDDDADTGSSSDSGDETELLRLADLAESDAIGMGSFQDTGFAVYCRQGSGYEDEVFAQIGFQPAGKQAKDEFCYNVSDDRTAVGLSRRSAGTGAGSCLILTLANGAVTRSNLRAMGESEGCRP